MIRRRYVLGFACGMAGVLLFVGSPALAFETHSLEGSFGPDGTAASEFTSPWSLGVDQSSGDIYVASLSGTIERFNDQHEPEPFTGAFPDIVDGQLTGFSHSEQPNQLAVSPVTRDFYVVSGIPAVVIAYLADGEPADFTAGPGSGTNEIGGSEVCGVAVDSSGDIYESEFATGVRVFSPNGELLTSIPSSGACNLAVDSHGNVYLSEPSGPVEKSIPSEFPVTALTSYASAGVVDSNSSSTVAIDPSSNRLYVDEGDQVSEYEEDGILRGTFGATGTSPLAGSAGLAVDDASGQVYVSNGEGETRQVEVFGPPLPSIDAASTANVTSVSVDLDAKINPNGLPTSYHFEYGPSAEYGSIVPVPDREIGSSTTDVEVEQQIQGLIPNVTYHWRLVATSYAGTTVGVDHTFVYETGGEALPDGRAYEMVTPPQKNGALIGDVLFGIHPDISEDGSRVIMSSIQCFAEAESCTGSRQTEGEQFLFSRSSAGWVTTALAPPATQFDANTGWLLSAETGEEMFSMPTPPTLEDDFYVRRADGSFLDIGPATPPLSGPLGTRPWGGSSIAATSDFSHVIYQEPAHFWPFGENGGGSVFEFAGTGNIAPSLVGVSGGRGSNDLISRCETTLGAGSSGYNPGEISADGETVYFTADSCPSGTGVNSAIEVQSNVLYARIGAARTVKLSGRSLADCTTEVCRTSEPGNAIFAGASSDGSKAFFTSDQQLTNSASVGGNLYEYDFDLSASENPIDVSAGDSSGRGPRVQGVVAISGDGSHIYFVAQGVLTRATNGVGQTARDGANNLYVFERDESHPYGQVAFVAQLPQSDGAQWEKNDEESYANVTPDGRFLVFESHGDLTSDDTRTDKAQQIFRYDAQTGQLTRISSGENGFNDDGNAGNGDASIVPAYLGFLHAGPSRRDPTMSHNGSYVFFQSPIALTRHALNDVQIGVSGGGPAYAQNVYEWHEGQIYLISDGRDTASDPIIGARGSSAVHLLGSDASGANVFFTTADALVREDTDTQLDVYDARICTEGDPCIKSGPEPAPPCLGEVCHGTPLEIPPEPSGGSAALSSVGRAVLPLPNSTKQFEKKHKRDRCPRGRVRRRNKCVRRQIKHRRARNAGFHKGGK